MPGRMDVNPRGWRCSSREARFCTHHGDCCCLRSLADDRITERSTVCPLHGLQTTHPFPSTAFVPPHGVRP